MRCAAVTPPGLLIREHNIILCPAGGAPLRRREPGTLERRLRRAARLGLDAADARALLAVAVVRLLVMPLATIAVVKGGLTASALMQGSFLAAGLSAAAWLVNAGSQSADGLLMLLLWQRRQRRLCLR